MPFIAAAAGISSISQSLTRLQQLKDMTAAVPGLQHGRVEPRRFASDIGDRVGFTAAQDVGSSGTVLIVPQSAAATRIDAEQHEVIGQAAADSSELVALSLWLMAERHKGAASKWHGFLVTLPTATLSPILWDDQEVDELLAGSPTHAEARRRKAALRTQWQELHAAHFSKDTTRYLTSVYNEQNFMHAFSVVLAHAIYLPSASCFALLPVVSQLSRTGSDSGCQVDYDPVRESVVVSSPRLLKKGCEVFLFDPRPNGELLLATGAVPDNNPSNCLLWDASLVEADRYFMLKSEILETLGLGPKEQFPVFVDRFPTQLLAYLRLARVADPALFAKVSFDKDVELSQMNEYEILQLLMGDCREKLQAYTSSLEEDVKIAQSQELNAKQRLAVKLRLGEKNIIAATMEAVRSRLAPIRGIPTKSGAMQDPNQDLKEIFDAIEAIPAAPVKLMGSFLSWARGEQDPDWGKKPSRKARAPKPW